MAKNGNPTWLANFFSPQRSWDPTKFFGRKVLVEKHFQVRKVLVEKHFRVRKMLVEKHFRLRKVLVGNCFSTNTFQPKP